jgi:hypothetical protein
LFIGGREAGEFGIENKRGECGYRKGCNEYGKRKEQGWARRNGMRGRERGLNLGSEASKK